MKATFKILIILTSILCSCGHSDNIPKTIVLQDTIDSKPTSKLEMQIAETLTLLQESDLKSMGQDQHEFRFYYFPSFESCKFFKLNYKDSSLTVKEFTNKKPDGSGEDKVLNSKSIKFTIKDFETLSDLVDKSMFWSLDRDMLKLSIDGSLYIYESKQFVSRKMSGIRKDYHIVLCNAPHNSDFINLGQFFLFKSGHKNIYKN